MKRIRLSNDAGKNTWIVQLRKKFSYLPKLFPFLHKLSLLIENKNSQFRTLFRFCPHLRNINYIFPNNSGNQGAGRVRPTDVSTSGSVQQQKSSGSYTCKKIRKTIFQTNWRTLQITNIKHTELPAHEPKMSTGHKKYKNNYKYAKYLTRTGTVRIKVH